MGWQLWSSGGSEERDGRGSGFVRGGAPEGVETHGSVADERAVVVEAACCGEGGSEDLFMSIVGYAVASHQVEGSKNEDGHDKVIIELPILGGHEFSLEGLESFGFVFEDCDGGWSGWVLKTVV